ncbi:MAG TPA: hypothetical protein HA345_02285 [Candidatus Thalassarchaeaceae archaeon]|nr:MAG TPA: hypothetical protein D7H94_02280 [Candidatus Poseidoniales archaeon]HIH84218.1 hypothetical protein [Candidatus Thalassarchaeaceae archaeon]|tara:strand:+ start:284 stop:523 length:240 start_codon:yes stop_codon:yes gene_type:complete
MAMADLTKFEMRIFKWICLEDNDFVNNPWSTKKAAKAFKVDEDEVYDALAALTEKIPHHIYVHYKDGGIRIKAEDPEEN